MFSFKLRRIAAENNKILKEVFDQLLLLNKKNDTIMSQQAVLADQLNQLTAQLGVVIPTIQQMEDALAKQNNVEPELQTAFDGFKNAFGGLVAIVNPPAAGQAPASGTGTGNSGGPAEGSAPSSGSGDGSTASTQS